MTAITCFGAHSVYAAPKLELLFDALSDMDKNGVEDRAALVLVGPGRTEADNPSKDFYALAEDEHVDLFIYLNGGNGPLDITQVPTARKASLISADTLRFVLPLSGNAKGSINIVTSNGFGNTFNTTETLTIVWRKGTFMVGGWAQDFYNSRDEQSAHCSVNYLTGKAVRRKNAGKNLALKGVFKPVLLADWSAAAQPKGCDEE
jgi:hypothetical protein